MPKRGSHHSRVGVIFPRRTAFDLSYEKKFTADFAELIPVMCDEVVPGDHFRIRTQTVVRTQPMFAPLLHEVKLTIHYFFCPYRLLMNGWEEFITGGIDGMSVVPLPKYPSTGLIIMNPGTRGQPSSAAYIPPNVSYGKNSLWDYFGFPVVGDTGSHYTVNQNMPLIFPFRAYNFVWSEYYRDENYQAKPGARFPDSKRYNNEANENIQPGPDNSVGTSSSSQSTTWLSQYANAFSDRLGQPYLRNWTKDYFTSALPWQQRGQAPAFPITGSLPITYDPPNPSQQGYPQVFALRMDGGSGTQQQQLATFAQSGSNSPAGVINNAIPQGSPIVASKGTVNLDQSISFNTKDLRHIVQLQKWMERNARAGVRYTEFLRAHFGVTPNDERLDRPEYIGGVSTNLIVSEVLQTSNNVGGGVGDQQDTPQGNMSGHGIMTSQGTVGGYFVKEFGCIIGIMSIMPTPSYEDGIDRQWLRRIKEDYYFPEFANLSEQGIYTSELYAQGVDTDWDVWGYQPVYDEMRIKRNMVVGDMRVNASQNLSFWHLGRHFTVKPTLSSNFIRCNPDQFSRCFAVTSQKPFIISHANIIKAVRPLPYIGEPGLVDHH